MICPNCRYQNRPTAKVCGQCGIRLPLAPPNYAPPVSVQNNRSRFIVMLAGLIGAVLLCVLAGVGAYVWNNQPTATPTSVAVVSPTLASTITLVPTVTATALPEATPTLAPAPPTNTPLPLPTVVGPKRLDIGGATRNTVNIFDINANRPLTLFSSPGSISGMILSAAWSPDGKQVLLSYNWNSAVYDYGHIVRVVDANGTNARDLIKTMPTREGVVAAHAYRDAIWSPDGATIAVRYQYGSDFGIWLINADGTNKRRLPSSEIGDWPRFWSVDGRWVIGVSSSDGILYAERIDSTERVPFEKIKGIRMYDERYYPWRETTELKCNVSGQWYYTGGAYWDCE